MTVELNDVVSVVVPSVLGLGWLFRLEAKSNANEKATLAVANVHKEILEALRLIHKDNIDTKIEVKVALERIEHLNRRTWSMKTEEVQQGMKDNGIL